MLKTMGLIKEPKNVDFTVLDKPWTVEDRKEFSTFIKLSKEQRKKNTAKSKRGKSNLNTNIPTIVSLAIVWLTENL